MRPIPTHPIASKSHIGSVLPRKGTAGHAQFPGSAAAPRRRSGALALAALWAPAAALAAGAPPPAEAETHSPSHSATTRSQHGGIVRAANASISCRAAPAAAAAPACPAVRAGQAAQNAANDDFDMFYVDVDNDPNTYNSSRAEVRLPEGARVTYARLYWGGNLRVGEQKPPKDNGRVLIAEPGGEYKAVLADTRRRPPGGAAAPTPSRPRRTSPSWCGTSGSGLYTVAQVNVAMGRSAAGAWGGWTLVVAYEKPEEPLRHLAVWDGFDALDAPARRGDPVRGLRVPAPDRAAGSGWSPTTATAAVRVIRSRSRPVAGRPPRSRRRQPTVTMC